MPTDADHAAVLRNVKYALVKADQSRYGGYGPLSNDEWAAIERAIWALDGGLTAAYDQGVQDGVKVEQALRPRVGSMSENDNG